MDAFRHRVCLAFVLTTTLASVCCQSRPAFELVNVTTIPVLAVNFNQNNANFFPAVAVNNTTTSLAPVEVLNVTVMPNAKLLPVAFTALPVANAVTMLIWKRDVALVETNATVLPLVAVPANLNATVLPLVAVPANLTVTREKRQVIMPMANLTGASVEPPMQDVMVLDNSTGQMARRKRDVMVIAADSATLVQPVTAAPVTLVAVLQPVDNATAELVNRQKRGILSGAAKGAGGGALAGAVLPGTTAKQGAKLGGVLGAAAGAGRRKRGILSGGLKGGALGGLLGAVVPGMSAKTGALAGGAAGAGMGLLKKFTG